GFRALRLPGEMKGEARGKDAGKGGERLEALPPMVVREYAHQRTHGADPSLRSDFAETLYWHPVLLLADGKADFSFDLCDSVTTFQVTAFAHPLDGRLGATTHTIDSRLPFTLQPKTPLEVTASDRIDVPLAVSNNTSEQRTVNVALKGYDGLALVRGAEREQLAIPAGTP